MPYQEGSSYGYYDPYPPAEADQILYEFSPVEERGDTSSTDFGGGAPRSRETRDLSWRDDVDAFLSGAKEPTCEQLRDMWRVARDIQQRRAMRTNEVPQYAADSNFVRYDSGGDRAAEAEEEESIGYGSSAAQTPRADRRRMSVPPHARSAAAPAPAREEKSVFGVVHTHEPVRPNGMHVRDPAKEIYGLLRGSTGHSKSTSSTPALSDFGNVRTHEDEVAAEAEQSYFDKLREKLHRESGGGDIGGDNRSSYGVVRFSEQHPTTSPTPSSLDRVREMVAANRMENDIEDEEGEDTSSFDLIRDRLMNTRLTSGRRTAAARLHGARNRAFRQKEESRQHRRRSVSHREKETFLSLRLHSFLKSGTKSFFVECTITEMEVGA